MNDKVLFCFRVFFAFLLIIFALFTIYYNSMYILQLFINEDGTNRVIKSFYKKPSFLFKNFNKMKLIEYIFDRRPITTYDCAFRGNHHGDMGFFGVEFRSFLENNMNGVELITPPITIDTRKKFKSRFLRDFWNPTLNVYIYPAIHVVDNNYRCELNKFEFERIIDEKWDRRYFDFADHLRIYFYFIREGKAAVSKKYYVYTYSVINDNEQVIEYIFVVPESKKIV